MVEFGGGTLNLQDIRTSQLLVNWLHINLDTEIREDEAGDGQMLWLVQLSQ